MDGSIGNEKTMAPAGKSGGHAYALKPGDTLGQYKVIRSLGAGGMGEVYEVEHKVLRRKYALKLLPPTLDWQGVSLERFQREAQVMANLDHPNILKVDDFGETDGRYWLRMELVEGCSGFGVPPSQSLLRTSQGSGKRVVSLQDLADSYGGKVPQEELLPILKQILDGLDYAHKNGAIHRDLKPSNILLSEPKLKVPDKRTYLVKIADFGLVKLVGEDWVRSQIYLSVQHSVSIGNNQTANNNEGTSTRAILGTYDYMSPEQKRGENITAKSDLYTVGLIAYRLLTGRAISPKLPSKIDPKLWAGWDDFIEKLIDEVDERQGDARLLMTTLDSIYLKANGHSVALPESGGRFSSELDDERNRSHYQSPRIVNAYTPLPEIIYRVMKKPMQLGEYSLKHHIDNVSLARMIAVGKLSAFKHEGLWYIDDIEKDPYKLASSLASYEARRKPSGFVNKQTENVYKTLNGRLTQAASTIDEIKSGRLKGYLFEGEWYVE